MQGELTQPLASVILAVNVQVPGEAHEWLRVTDPFWAVTRYDDIARVSRQPRMFLNAPRLAFSSRRFPVRPPEDFARSLLNT